MTRNILLAGLALLACGLGMVGCGTGDSGLNAPGTGGLVSAPSSSVTTPRGTVQFTILWPQPTSDRGAASRRTRLIPAAANSIRIILADAKDGTSAVAQVVVSRPATGQNTSTAILNNVAAIPLIALAFAYPNADGTGVAQASGSVAVTAISNQTVTAPPLTMKSTIAALQVVPNPLTVIADFTAPIHVSATDASGAVVLLPTFGTTLTYAIDNTSLATVTNTGNAATITGVKSGTATLTVTDSESGKSNTGVINIVVDTGGLNVPIQ